MLPPASAVAGGTDYELIAGWVIHDATVTCPGSAAPVPKRSRKDHTGNRRLYQPVPENAVLDDFMISMLIAQNGYKIVYEPEAYATEGSSENVSEELKSIKLNYQNELN